MGYNVIPIRNRPELYSAAAEWFSSKWHIPKKAYEESISECLTKKAAVPQWYLVFDDGGNIAAGLGVIENDFHKRTDLSPNICAVFVEPEHRKKGVAKMMLNLVCRDISGFGIENIYLITDHTDFYEKCGFEYFCNAEENDGEISRMYRRCLKNE